MKVKELIKHLKQFPQETQVMAKDVHGNWASYIEIYPHPTRDEVYIHAMTEPYTPYCDHPFDLPDVDE